MNEKQFEFYKKLLQMSQVTLKNSLKEFLVNLGYSKVVETTDYIFAEGSIPICLIAHLDTVFDKPPSGIFYDRVEGVIWSPQGCGHDDRAGVFMIIQLLSKGYRPHVIFTTDEERGCLGASVLAKVPMPFNDCHYMIQLDRKGYDDCVFYYDENEEFHKYVETFGFRTQPGSFTDIVVLCPAWGVAGVNLSVGYFNEHTPLELLFTQFYNDTKEKVIQMLENPPEERFEYKESVYNPLFNNSSVLSTCERCGDKVSIEDLFPIVAKDKNIKMFCTDCLMKKVDWCETCNRAFEVDKPMTSGKYMCPECKKGRKNGARSNSKKRSRKENT